MNGSIDLEHAQTPPGVRLVAIGDIHGCAHLLDRLLDAIDAEIAADQPSDWRIFTLGDYVDRGPDSRGVLDRLISRYADPRFICLVGNHDDGMRAFLDETEGLDGSGLFINYGGVETAASYGVDLDIRSEASIVQSHAALTAAVPEAHRVFLADLPPFAESGDFFFCHAGIRPGVALFRQTREDLTWIRGDFLHYRDLHPKLVVHGHTPKNRPEILPNRINIDTGAFASGYLSALVAEGTRKWLLQAHVRGVERLDIQT